MRWCETVAPVESECLFEYAYIHCSMNSGSRNVCVVGYDVE